MNNEIPYEVRSLLIHASREDALQIVLGAIGVRINESDRDIDDIMRKYAKEIAQALSCLSVESCIAIMRSALQEYRKGALTIPQRVNTGRRRS